MNGKYSVLIFAFAVVFVPVFVIEYMTIGHTGGSLIYPLDDTFIHMAVAKNLALHHNWGINPFEFGSASSSLLYTLLLGGLFSLFSAGSLIPFLINCVAAAVLLVVVWKWARKEGIGRNGQLVLFAAIAFFTPLPILIISGMEHTLQCLFCFLFLFGFADWLGVGVGEGRPGDAALSTDSVGRPGVSLGLRPGESELSAAGSTRWKLPPVLYGYAMLVCMIRYEGLFLVGMACLLLLCYGRLGLAIRLGLFAILPLIVFGLFSVSRGSYFLPNSVLLKSESFPFTIQGMMDYVNNILVQKLTIVRNVTKVTEGPRTGITTLATQRLLIILPLAALLCLKWVRERSGYIFVLVILTGCTALQLSFASTGWLYRYEAYLMFCAVLILFLLGYRYGRQLLGGTWGGGALRPGELGGGALAADRMETGAGVWPGGWVKRVVYLRGALLLALLFALFFPFVLRSMAAFTKTGQACINIYQQQYQMGLFLQKYYDKDAVAANDVGVISYLTEGNNLDLWGLGNIQVARSRKGGYWTPDFLDSLSRRSGVKVAVVFDSWFPDSLLHRWQKVATWQIQNNVICGDDKVTFYALDMRDAPALKENLREFQGALPVGVGVRYY